MVRKYNLDQYYVDRLLLVKDEICALFPEELTPESEGSKQFSLTDFMRATPLKK